ncbi:MAG: hypothetical protein AB198_00975 [Parcubacteria bacterium C7867-003]|nr:MAG: hypothetical protein AB198_00975 [Parcubacteria bacterium C7867-003]
MNPELQKYVSQARGSGRSDMQITQDLRSNGWNENDISFALGINTASNPVPKPPVVPNRLMRKEVLAGLVFIILLGTGIYFVASKSRVDNTPKIHYVDSNGVISFDRPSTWIIPPEKNAAMAMFYIQDGENKNSIASPNDMYGNGLSYGTFTVIALDDESVAKDYSEEAIRKSGLTFTKKDTVVIDGIQSNKIVLDGSAYGGFHKVSNTMIIVPFPSQKMNIIIYYSANSSKVLNEIDKVVDSIKIDKSKVSALVDGLSALRKEASMKALLYGMRPSAEIYYDSHKNSYAGICADTVNDLTKPLRDLRSQVDPNIKCTSVSTSYAISLLSPKKEYWCIDSTGFAGVTSNYHSGTVCR